MVYFVTSFYKLAHIENYYDMKPDLLNFCKSLGLKGTLVLSQDGMRCAACAESTDQLDMLIDFLGTDNRLRDIKYCASSCDFLPYTKMVVRLKYEVANMGCYDTDMGHAGKKVSSGEWDQIIQRDDVAVLDVRNDFEFDMGTFNNAVRPDVSSFCQFVPWFEKWRNADCKNASGKKKLAIFCTEGIRCEKFGGYASTLGYEVYNLDLGILQYLRDKKGEPSAWNGDCFVFDDRVAVDRQLKPNAHCHVCGATPELDCIRVASRSMIVCNTCTAKTHFYQ